MESKKKYSKLDIAYFAALAIKLVDAVLEMLAGILLLIVHPRWMRSFAFSITHDELSRDPRDLIANALHQLGNAPHKRLMFIALYFFFHGLIKLILSIELLRERQWVYIPAMVTLGIFVLFEVYRSGFDHSVWLGLATVLDLATIALVYLEYDRKRQLRLAGTGSAAV